MEPYPIAVEAIDLEVYVLSTLFSGSERLTEIEREHSGLRWARHTFEASEASRRLIALAVMLRSQMDSSPHRRDTVVGSLVRDVREPSKETPLKLREACNKIIHAESVDLSPGKWEHSETPSLSSRVTLEGTHGEKEWLANLDVLAFLDAACIEA